MFGGNTETETESYLTESSFPDINTGPVDLIKENFLDSDKENDLKELE